MARRLEVENRLRAEPGVENVIGLQAIPGSAPLAAIEVEGFPGTVVGTSRIDVDLFPALGVPVRAGRQFTPADAGTASGGEWRDGDGDGFPEYRAGEVVSTSAAVLVNQSFVRDALGGASALGRRLRHAGRMDDGQSAVQMQWHEIVGVVNDYPAQPMEPDAPRAMVYHPIAAGESTEFMAMRLNGISPSGFGERLREIVADVDPALRVHDVRPLDVALREEHLAMRMVALGLAIVTASVILLSAAGIYSMMAFTVERRRREIGIRLALGADHAHVVRGIFSRALGQLAIGVVAGAVFAPVLLMADGPLTMAKWLTLVVVSALVLLTGLLASVGPTRRSFRIQPIEALREA
jgi:hypothetical protein